MPHNVIFIAFANSQEHPLPTLTREEHGVYKILVNSNKESFTIHRESNATLEKINEYLGVFVERISVFLYSGHAGKDSLLLTGMEANSNGIAYQLSASAKKGYLKLVVLNGCSTAGQVKRLLEAGVPAIAATNAPVDDKSATEFSLRFFENLFEKRMTIRHAFSDALGPAQTATRQDLGHPEKPARHINYVNELADNTPLWELFCKDPEAIDINPIPIRPAQPAITNFEPNERLTRTLFDTLYNDGNQVIKKLKEEEEETGDFNIYTIRKTLLQVLPYPVATNLRKLLCPFDDTEGYDKITSRRLSQIGEVFHIVMEFLGIIMIAQLWEMKLRNIAGQIPDDLVRMLHRYFYLNSRERETFDYLSFIHSLRQYFDTLNDNNGVTYFVEELERLRDFSKEGQQFASACSFLAFIRKQTRTENIAEQEIFDACIEAEINLCYFFEKLGFLHRYTLTSIQQIDILKYRHDKAARFNHQVIKLMDVETMQHHFYVMPVFLDNNGVVLIKQGLQKDEKKKKHFTAESLDFLNLSPFVVDPNAFKRNTESSKLARSYLCFFQQYRKSERAYFYKNVKLLEEDIFKVYEEGDEKDQEKSEAVRLQFDAFRKLILDETYVS